MHDLKVTEYHGIRVLTSAQVAQMYETDTKTISYNFSYNKRKYIEGKHYIKLEGTELKEFKASREIPDCHKFSAHLYLWTEKEHSFMQNLLIRIKHGKHMITWLISISEPENRSRKKRRTR